MSMTKFDVIKAKRIEVQSIKVGADKNVSLTPIEKLVIETKNTSIKGGTVNITADENKNINFTTSGTGKLLYNGSEIGQGGGTSGIPNEGNNVNVDFTLTRDSATFNAANNIAFSATQVTVNNNEVATKNDLEEFVTLSDLDDYVKAEELDNYATKSDISNFITADALQGYATTDDLANKADKSELDNYATIDSLNSYATVESVESKADKSELNNYATKSDISDFVTSDDLQGYATVESVKGKANQSDVDTLNNTIVELNNVIDTLQNKIDILERRFELLKDDVQAFREDMDDVVDLHPEKPGVQDFEGETTFYVNNVEDVTTALENLSDGDAIRIKSDISTDEIGNALVFDGQDNTLSIGNTNTFTSGSGKTNNIKVLNGTLTVTGNGTIDTTDAYDNTHSTTLLAAESGGTLILDGVKVNAVIGDTPEQAVDKGQFGVGVYGDGNVVIENADLTTGWYCISGNGTTTSADATVTINGGNLTSTVDFAIYHPYPGTLTINDGNIIGGAGAISMNNGNAIINGGNLSSRGDGDTGSWSDGTSGQADAIINLNAKYGAVNCEINGGTFTATGDAEIIVSKNPKFPVTVSVKGGRFNKQLTNPDWIAEGYVMSDVPDSEGYYVVTKA